MRRRKTPGDVVLVVEGARDRKCVLRLTEDRAMVIPAFGKANLLFAFDNLEQEFRRTVLFLVDCDNKLDRRYKGHRDLVITENRDIEADLVLTLKGLAGFAAEFLDLERRQDCDRAVEAILPAACGLSARLNSVLEGARQQGARSRIEGRDRVNRRIRLLDIPDQHELIGLYGRGSIGAFVDRLAAKLSWSGDERSAITESVRQMTEKPCRRHGRKSCDPCWHRSFCNGHDLVDAVAIVCAASYSLHVGDEVVERAVRMGYDLSGIEDWPVIERIRNWEVGTGVTILRGRPVATP